MSEFKRDRKDYHMVGKCVPKKDSNQLLLGKPVFMDDIVPQDCLVVKLLRSPHAHALVEEVKTVAAAKVPGIEAIYTWKDVPKERFCIAGQTYPEPSPYDRLILDQRVRCVGDPVAIVAGENEKAVDKALRLIKVKYQVLEPILDFRKALDNEVLVHPEENWKSYGNTGDVKRNLLHHEEDAHGDVEQVLSECDEVIEHSWRIKAAQQGYMETIRAYCEIDRYGRLHCISSTQIVFHVRRIIANALGIPKSMVRAEKPRIGGGFGAKQTAVCEVYPAFVTWMTKKPCKLIYSRKECQTIASPRHEMEVTVRLGAMKDGHIRAIDLYTLSNTGAYGEHGTTTVGLSGHKALPLYTGGCEATRFSCDVVYTNVQAAGAYRGYGATQGLFAVESAVNELAHKLNMDPFALRLKNTVQEGDVMPAYYGAVNTSCALDRCLVKVREMIDWEHKYPARDLGNGKVRAVGMGMAMQGSGISGMDVGSATLKLNDDGFYSLIIGAADMGTGCDTTLAQIAAEVLDCPLDNIAVFGADTDTSPYDSGSYASSTTYVTGKATEKCAMKLREQICKLGAELLGCPADAVEFDGKEVFESAAPETKKTLSEIAYASQFGHMVPLEATETHTSPLSPPPFMVGAAEVEVDTETGEVKVLEFDTCVDCGTPINPNLTRVQAEGGILQGIGMTLTENVTYDRKGCPEENSLFQYKIPTRIDIGKINVEFENSYEPNGPFGAKSIGEVVINTPLPAISDAIYNAIGTRFYELPITPEQIAMAAAENHK